jgi:pimeloyl-ACP methyl ester carboxylesterase
MTVESPNTNPIDKKGSDTLVVFVHGFTGEGVGTWGKFQEFLENDTDLAHCRFRFWDYPTELASSNLNPVHLLKKLFWEDDPNIKTVSQGLRTMLMIEAEGFEKIVLFAHSMGGLVVQRFILDEIQSNRPALLDRITEVGFFGTPSGGLEKAEFGKWLKNQIADMSVFSAFLVELRNDWARLIDERRFEPGFPLKFRLTLSAGMKDTFVPQSSSLGPFPFDEKEIIPGNHTTMLKPEAANDLVYRLIKRRLTRGTLTAEQWRQINGETKEAIEHTKRIRAAADLGLNKDLEPLATRLLTDPARLPRVERELGLALLDGELYQKAADLLTRYLEFQLADQSQPFASDAQATQQLAIALSGAGDLIGAVSRLRQLDRQVQDDPETQGILAGRFKRRWLKDQKAHGIGRQALDLYQKALSAAEEQGDTDQAFYNGINAAYLSFALGGQDFSRLAQDVLAICDGKLQPDYWCEATRGEAYLLLGDYQKATTSYEEARRRLVAQRHWTATGQQARDILERQHNPPGAESIIALFSDVKPDYLLQDAG